MKTITKITGIALLVVLAFTSCKKETAGPKGDTGANGTNGTNGTANIVVNTFTTSTTSWTVNTWPYNYLEALISVPAITSTVVSNGDVRVYMLDAAGTSWMGMPYSFLASQYNYKFKTGEVIIDFTLYNNTTPSNPGTQQFKVVIMPPGFIKNNPDVDWNNYNEVKASFELD